MRQSTSWDPGTYDQYRRQRTRPFHDLIGQVPCTAPALVVDLGAGNGPTTLELTKRWPDARIVGVDSSETMLEAARDADTDQRVEWVLADVRDWDPASLGQPADVIVTNSVLQWVPGHLELIGRWVDSLAVGGWFALQVPDNFDAPSHRLMREVATHHSRSAELENALEVPDVGAPATYLRLLSRLGCRADVWETTYTHVLDPEGKDDDPVVTWVRATALRPVLDLLHPGEVDSFMEPYAAALHQAYPRTDAGVLFPFRRVFAVGKKTG